MKNRGNERNAQRNVMIIRLLNSFARNWDRRIILVSHIRALIWQKKLQNIILPYVNEFMEKVENILHKGVKFTEQTRSKRSRSVRYYYIRVVGRIRDVRTSARLHRTRVVEIILALSWAHIVVAHKEARACI